MKVAILESIVTPAGHEVEFDRILVDELNRQGHEPVMFVPEKFPFKVEYKASVNYLDGGEAISYAGVGRLKRLWLSLQRERRRIAWFNSAYKKGANKECEAIIVPTVSWRALRSIKKSKLIHSTVPVLLILHGIMPSDRKRFVELVEQLKEYQNIHIAVLGLQDDFDELNQIKTFHTLKAPVYKPVYANRKSDFIIHTPLKLGFFGQYRREKNLEFFLKGFIEADFKYPVQLMVQGATMTEDDSKHFDALIEEYRDYENIVFLHKNLLGKEWEDALMGVDALLLPYGAERYKYQPSAMLFTAIGYNKPVLVSKEINNEVVNSFCIGKQVDISDKSSFIVSLEEFVYDLCTNFEQYRNGLESANKRFSQEQLVNNIIGIFR